MGASTALLHGGRDPSMACMVLDSPFTDLTQLAEELVQRGRNNGMFAPSIAVAIALRAIRSSVLSTAGFDIRDISPISYADSCFIPALFVAGESDAFIAPQHSVRLCERYGGDKNLILVKGDHNSQRPVFLYDSVSIFLINALRIPEQWLLRGMTGAYVGRSPWRLASSLYSSFGSEAAASVERRTSFADLGTLVAPRRGGAEEGGGAAGGSTSRRLQEEVDAELAWRLMREELDAIDREQARPAGEGEPRPEGEEPTELEEGMTRARQQQVLGAIQGVFGGARQPAAPAASSDLQHKTDARNTSFSM